MKGGRAGGQGRAGSEQRAASSDSTAAAVTRDNKRGDDRQRCACMHNTYRLAKE